MGVTLSLPVAEVLTPLIEGLLCHNQILLLAPPGAGKSTWLPLQFLKQSWLTGKIIMLEPRRLAARNVAIRLAQQYGEVVGLTIGYRIRGESCVSLKTRLEIVTEGILTKMLQQDPTLDGVNLVIFDEFHERNLQADLALALLLDSQQALRDDLRLLIMSATLDDQGLSKLLPDALLLKTSGNAFPVQREYITLPAQSSLTEAIGQKVLQLMEKEEGSLLLFLPGQTEINQIGDYLTPYLPDNTDLYPLYGALSLSQQQQAIQPAILGRRKIVLATNIAETSLTIDGIRLVIDCATERIARFDIKSGFTQLITQRISKASMIQRAGRAGRIMPGICWHLLNKEQADRLVEQSEPEIILSDLSGLYLNLLYWGCHDADQLLWLTPPPKSSLLAAKHLLRSLGAIDEQDHLSSFGKKMASSGSEPRLAAMLLYGQQQGAIAFNTAARLVAILEQPPHHTAQSDIYVWFNQPYQIWLQRAEQLRQQEGIEKTAVNPDLLPTLLAVGFPDRIAARRNTSESYLLANGTGATLHHQDSLNGARYLIIAALLQSGYDRNTRILLAITCEPLALVSLFPTLLSSTITVKWSEEQGTLRSIRRQKIGQIILNEQILDKPSQKDIHQALLDWLRQQGINQLDWNTHANQLIARLVCAKKWFAEYDWPAVDEQTLLDKLDTWLLPELDNVQDIKALKRINVADALRRLMNWQQIQRLEQWLPTHYRLPTGNRVQIKYDSERPPTISARIQELFGEPVNPRIAQNRVVITIELLSPANRILHITSDLAAFWRGAYRQVQKEMKGRYPKHVWPDDPLCCLPTYKTKKKQS